MSDSALKLASEWENLKVVRRRFGIRAEWLHTPVSAGGEEALQSNPALKANFKVLITIVKAAGLQKVGVHKFKAEATAMQNNYN